VAAKKVSQRKIDDTLAGRFPKIVLEVAQIAGEGLEDRIKELMGDTYRTPEEREVVASALGEVMAEKRAAQSRAGGSAGGSPWTQLKLRPPPPV
jgi:hypothetical protein